MSIHSSATYAVFYLENSGKAIVEVGISSIL